MWESRKSPGLFHQKPDPQDRAFGVIVEHMFADDPFPPGLLDHLAPHLLLLALVTAVAFGGILARRSLQRRSQSWTGVPGHVESITVTTDASRGSVFRPQMLDIAYSYVAGGERYAAFESLSFRRLDAAEACAAGLRDADISVCYNPRSPQQSTIDFPPGIRR